MYNFYSLDRRPTCFIDVFRCVMLAFSSARNFRCWVSIVRKKGLKILVFSLVLSILGISTTEFVAHANASHTDWMDANTGYLDKKVVGVEQVITPLESGGDRFYYWATVWNYAETVDGGYMGVQTEGSRWDINSFGPIAIFSIWGATSATPGPGAVCRPFNWEGIGIQCRLDLYTVMTGNKMTVQRSADGLSWTAQIEQTNEPPKVIATISVSAIYSIKYSSNFQEFYGKDHALCGEHPGAAVKFRFPKYVFEDGTTSRGTFRAFNNHNLINNVSCIAVDQKEFNPGLEVFMRQGKSLTPIPETKSETEAEVILKELAEYGDAVAIAKAKKEAAEAKAKLEKEAAEAAARAKAKAELQVAVEAPVKYTKFSLICVKGSTVKRVVGNNPKCSSGFKKNGNLTGVNLKNANLSGANLSGANLSQLNMSGANLTGVYLTNVDLNNSKLRSANLTRATLFGANLTSATLFGANLSQANLIYANLSGANLSKANLSRGKLSYIDLTGADLTGADLTRANLVQANLSGANLSGANLSGANLYRANLSGANLTGANLSRTNLFANLSGANLSCANLFGANVDASISSAILSGKC